MHACRWYKNLFNKSYVPYGIPAASNVSTPLCMRVAGTNMCLNILICVNKLYVPFDIPAASYVSTPPSMRVPGIYIITNHMFANKFAPIVRTQNPGEEPLGKGVSRTALERQALDALNFVPCSTIFSCRSCLPFRYLALLATQAAAANEQSGEWAT